MQLRTVCAVYFSATDTTKKIVKQIAGGLAGALQLSYQEVDFTLPQARTTPLEFSEGQLIVFGTPVYAGRVPNVLLKYLAQTAGNSALAIPVVVYGNRDYDDALIELRDLLEKSNLHTVAAAAFIGEHSFSKTLAAGRPDGADFAVADRFVRDVAEKVRAISGIPEPVYVKGTPYPYRGYYQPRDRKGTPVDIRKVKPLTNERCDGCKLCAAVCPMGSIDPGDVRQYTGICIKCGACIKKCPQQAKYYADEGYLYHQHELEEGLTRRAEPELFL